MAFWTGLVLFILVAIVAERLFPPQYKKFMPILVMCVLTFFGLFRYEIGTDYDWYVVLFDTVTIDDLYPEPTFLLLVKFLHQFHFSYQMMFIAYELPIMLLLWNSIRYYTKDTEIQILIIALFYCLEYYFSLNGIRQGLSMVLIFWGYRYCLERSLWKYLLVVALAASIHYSAIIAGLLYFVPTRVFSWYKYAIVFTLTFLVFKLNIVLIFLSIFFGILHVDGRYLNYLSDVDSVKMTGLYMFVKFGLFSIARIAIMELKPQYKGLLNIWFLGLLGHFLFAFSLPITRLTKYFEYFIILIIPYMIQYLNFNFLLQVKDKVYNFKWGYIILLFYMYTFFNMMSGIPQDYVTHWRNPYPSSMNIDYQFNFKIFDR